MAALACLPFRGGCPSPPPRGLPAALPLRLRGRLSREPAPPRTSARVPTPAQRRPDRLAGRALPELRTRGREPERGQSGGRPLGAGTGEPRGTGTGWAGAALPVSAHRMQVTAATFCFYCHYYHIAREAEFVKKCNLAC